MTKKMSLTDLKVTSFVTNLNAVRGGDSDCETQEPCNTNATCNFKCSDTAYWLCCSETTETQTACTQEVCTFGGQLTCTFCGPCN